MHIPKFSDKIKIHEAVWREIRAIAVGNKALAARLVQRIAELGIDPNPNNEDCKSKMVANLAKKKIFVKRLRCFDVGAYRIFYCVKKSGFICVYAVVFASGDKHDQAYDENSEHYKRIQLLYKFWRSCQ